MKFEYSLVLLLGGIDCIAQPGAYSYGGSGAWGGNFANFPSCAQSCSPQWDKDTCSANSWGTCICSEPSAIATIKSCIDSSSCSDAEKNEVYQKIASLCASAGTTLTNEMEASFTGSLLTLTTTGPWAPNATPWSNGPFFNGNGYGGPWTSGPWTSGPWTSGPWTSWWNGNVCPSPSWPGWTSGRWSTDPQWTTWTACSAETTSSTVVVTTDTNGLVSSSTSFGVKVAAQTAAGTSAATGLPTVSATTPPDSKASQICSGRGFWILTFALLVVLVHL